MGDGRGEGRVLIHLPAWGFQSEQSEGSEILQHCFKFSLPRVAW